MSSTLRLILQLLCLSCIPVIVGALVIWLSPWNPTAGPLIGYYLVAVGLHRTRLVPFRGRADKTVIRSAICPAPLSGCCERIRLDQKGDHLRSDLYRVQCRQHSVSLVSQSLHPPSSDADAGTDRPVSCLHRNDPSNTVLPGSPSWWEWCSPS